MPKIHFISVKPEVPPTGYWDHCFLSDLLVGVVDLGDREVAVIPGAYQTDVYDELNAELAKFPKVLVIVTSDEEGKFNITKLSHPDMIVYSQYGNGGRMMPLGYTPGTREKLRELGPVPKTQNVFFAGQVTHARRKGMAEELKKRSDALLEFTDGFAKGYPRGLYFQMLADSKIVPCPPGPISQDSFRLYEALEAGCIPLVDDVSPIKSSGDHFWAGMLRDFPFPVYFDYDQINPFIDICLESPDLANHTFAWWINKKYRLRQSFSYALGVKPEDTAVIVPVSPIPSHPDTAILEETIASIRAHLPTAPILVTIDGVREEQKAMTDDYREFIRRFLWKCNFEYENVLPVIFSEHVHQSGMMKAVLGAIEMPYLLYVEADTPLTPDREIPWDQLKMYLHRGDTNLVRFHFEAFIPEPHKHLMEGFVHTGAPLMKTTQWSQRPHLALTEYYRQIMTDHFSEKANTFIEDRMHSVVQTEGWLKHKLTIYHPSGDIKRSYHLDGRAGAEKYDKTLVY